MNLSYGDKVIIVTHEGENIIGEIRLIYDYGQDFGLIICFKDEETKIWRQSYHGGTIVSVNDCEVDFEPMIPKYKHLLSHMLTSCRLDHIHENKGLFKTYIKNMLYGLTLNDLQNLCEDLSIYYPLDYKVVKLKELLACYATNK